MKNNKKDEAEALRLIMSAVEAAIKLIGENLQAQANKSQIQIEGVGFISILLIKETHEIFLHNYKKGLAQKIDEKTEPIIPPPITGETGNSFGDDAHDDLGTAVRKGS